MSEFTEMMDHCVEVMLEAAGQVPPFVLVGRKFYESAIKQDPHIFDGFKVTLMEPIRG